METLKKGDLVLVKVNSIYRVRITKVMKGYYKGITEPFGTVCDFTPDTVIKVLKDEPETSEDIRKTLRDLED